MALTPLDEIIAQVKTHEGWRGFVYDDATGHAIRQGSIVKGHPTIGWGFCLSADRGSALPKTIGELWLHDLIAERAVQVRTRLPWTVQSLNTVRFGVLVEMAYQMGIGGLLEFERFLTFAEDGQYERAAEAMLDSRWAMRQTPKRAHELAQVFELGK
jgi:lysozyme